VGERDLGGAVRRCIVCDPELCVWERRAQAVERGPDPIRLIAGGDYDKQGRLDGSSGVGRGGYCAAR